ncbi:hypothetical protein FJ251_15470, partial [bacterium]|nr:hypothetical protein [bacterium]
MKRIMLLAALALLATAGAARAESSLVGLMQAWWSYTAYEDTLPAVDEDATQTGFGLRRARAGWSYKQGDLGGLVVGEVTGDRVYVLEAYGDWKVNELLGLRAGRFGGVGSQAGCLTSSAKLDLIDVNLVGSRWSSATVGSDGRTIGAQLNLTPNEVFSLRVLAHNGTGNWNLDFTPSNSSHGDPTAVDEDDEPAPTMVDTGALPQLDFGVYANPTPALAVGFTYGLPHEFRQTTGSLTAFVYYTAPRSFLKFDYATLMHNPVWDENDADYTSLGYSLTAGYGLTKKAELVGRYETWDEDTDVDYDTEDPGEADPSFVKNFALGLNYYVNPEAKYDQVLKAAFTLRMDEMPEGVDIADPYLFQLMWQIYL